MDELVLEGIDGGSPLGFLATLGTLVALDEKWPGSVSLTWIKAAGYQPSLRFPISKSDQSMEEKRMDLAEAVAEALRIPAPEPPQASSKAVERLFKVFLAVRRDFEDGQKALRKREGELKQVARKKGIRGDPLKIWLAEQTAQQRTDIAKQGKEVLKRRQEWLEGLDEIVPSRELRLGKTVAVTSDEYRDVVILAMESSCGYRYRREVDFLSAFAAETVTNRGQVEATPFCFVTGSGQQYFLETVGKLMRLVDSPRIERCLFYSWCFEDERLSLRWAPAEDRRYGLMWDDPSSQEARTVWAANLLAYNGLRLLPVADVGRRLGTTGFSQFGPRRFFSWPIWEGFLTLDVVRSLLSCSILQQLKPEQAMLTKMGILEVFRCERVQVGNPPRIKINFSLPFPAGNGEESLM